MTAKRVWTAAEVAKLPVSIDLTTAGQILGIGRNLAHELAKDGRFPVQVNRLGNKLLVPTAELRRYLSLPDEGAQAS